MGFPHDLAARLGRLFPHYGIAHLVVSLVISAGVTALVIVAALVSRDVQLAALIWVLAPGAAFYAGREIRDWEKLGRFDRPGFWWPVGFALGMIAWRVLGLVLERLA